MARPEALAEGRGGRRERLKEGRRPARSQARVTRRACHRLHAATQRRSKLLLGKLRSPKIETECDLHHIAIRGMCL